MVKSNLERLRHRTMWLAQHKNIDRECYLPNIQSGKRLEGISNSLEGVSFNLLSIRLGLQQNGKVRDEKSTKKLIIK